MKKTENLNKRLLEEERVKRLLKSEEDYEKGRFVDAEELFEEWNIKFGIQN